MDDGYYARKTRVCTTRWVGSPRRARTSEGILMKDLLHHVSPSGLPWAMLLVILLCCCCPAASNKDQVELRYKLSEEETPGTFIADIKKDSQISQRLHDTTVLESIRFQFLTSPGVTLAVNDVTGRLTVSGRVDRDSICPSEPDCLIKLDIAIKPVQYLEIIKVTIELLDKNDNSPEFPEPEMTYRILESALPKHTLMLPAARDPDSPKYGIKQYRMISLDDSDTFKLLKNQKIDGSTELRLQLNTHLNREERDSYHLRIKCSDGAPRPRVGVMDIYIEVEDTNDNPPVFQNVDYSVHVPENLPVGHSVIKVVAVDSDLGLNGEVEYSFSSYTTESYGQVFRIDKVTGVVKIKTPLDHERVSSYTLAVSAKDKGPNSVSAETKVTVKVIDVNDNAPNITVNLLQKSAELQEDSPAGTFIAHISVTDRDSDNNGLVNCSLSDSHFRLQELYSAQYKLVTASKLDREQQARYTLSVICTDGGDRPQTSIRDIPVNVLDINDNSPLFSRPNYRARIVENNPVGHYVVQVNATDRDAGNNSRIVYSLTRHVSDSLHIDPETGVITARKRLDREKIQMINFPVIAKDHGSPRRSSTGTVFLDIEDINDTPPDFASDLYVFGVMENMPRGTRVGQVMAKDPDLAPGNEFVYSLRSNASMPQKFAIDRNNGTVTTLEELDVEDVPVYIMYAVATDTHSPELSTSAKITVHIKDDNDHSPFFVFPVLNNNTARVSNKAIQGHRITKILADDKDSGNSNGKFGITFTINAGNEDGLFNLDNSSGWLSVNKTFDHISFQVFELEVVAKDGGTPAKSAFSLLRVEVDESIVFSLHQPTSSIFGTGNFTTVLSLTCACVCLSVILIAVIVFIRRKEKQKKIRKYNCRMEALKMLTAKEPGYSPQPQVDVQSPSSQDGQYSDCSDSLKRNYHTYDDGNHTSSKNNAWSSGQEKQVKFAIPNRYVDLPSAPAGRSLEKREVEVHRFLDSLTGTEGERDKDSIHSGDGSNTDSGRGPSEEGEARHYVDINRLGGPRQGALPPSRGGGLSHSSTLPHHMSHHHSVHHHPHQNHVTSGHHTINPRATTAAPSPVHLNHPPQGRLATFSTPQKLVSTNRDNNNSVVETTYVPNHTNSNGNTPKAGRTQNVTETTFAPSSNTSAQNVTETTYVPQGNHTSQGHYQRPRKYLPINNNARDTTL